MSHKLGFECESGYGRQVIGNSAGFVITARPVSIGMVWKTRVLNTQQTGLLPSLHVSSWAFGIEMAP